MKNSFNRCLSFATCCLCVTLTACGTDSKETASLRTQQTVRSSTVPNEKPMTDAERIRLQGSLSPRLSRSSQGLVSKRTSTGSQRIDLRGQFQHMSVATRGPDGQLTQQCVSTPEELNQLLVDTQERDRNRMRRRP